MPTKNSNSQLRPPQQQLECLDRGYRGTARTIKFMHELVAQAKVDPTIQRIATWIRLQVPTDATSRSRELADAVFYWVARHGVYQRDPHQIEKLENVVESMRPVVEARRAAAYSGPGLFLGDCDTFAIWIAALGGVLGYPYAFETVKTDRRRPDEFSHVYAALFVPGIGWYPLDPSTPGVGPGWRPPVPASLLKRWDEPEIARTVGMSGNDEMMSNRVPEAKRMAHPSDWPGHPEVPYVGPTKQAVHRMDLAMHIPQLPAQSGADLIARWSSELQRAEQPEPHERDFLLTNSDPSGPWRPVYEPPKPRIHIRVPYHPSWPWARQVEIVPPAAGVGSCSVPNEQGKKAASQHPEALGLGEQETVLEEWKSAGRVPQDKQAAVQSALAAADIPFRVLPPRDGQVEIEVPAKLLPQAQAVVAQHLVSAKTGSIIDAILGVIPGLSQRYIEAQKAKMEARVAAAAARTVQATHAVAPTPAPKAAVWYTNPVIWGLGIAAMLAGSVYIATRPKRRRQ